MCIKVKLRKAKGLKHCVRILTGLKVNVHRHQRKPTNRIRNDVLTFTTSLTFVPAFLKGGSIGELRDEVSLCGKGEPGCHQQEMPSRCQNRNSRVFITLTDTAPYAQTHHYWKQWLRLPNARKDLERKGSALVSSTVFAKEKGEEHKRGACPANNLPASGFFSPGTGDFAHTTEARWLWHCQHSVTINLVEAPSPYKQQVS